MRTSGDFLSRHARGLEDAGAAGFTVLITVEQNIPDRQKHWRDAAFPASYWIFAQFRPMEIKGYYSGR